MSEDPRPYPPTDWEEDNAHSAEEAVRHADRTMEELVELSKDMAASGAAVEKLTRESVIQDNRRFRRRNAVLVILLVANMLLTAGLLGREILVVGPQRNLIENIAVQLEECTTPGPREPTADDPGTGHECYDDGRSSQAAAIAQIVDADGNGQIDTQEILDAIERFETFLPDPDE